MKIACEKSITQERITQERINKWIAFIRKETKADVSKMGIVEIEHLVRHCLFTISLEFPQLAKDIAEEIKFPFKQHD